MKKFLMYSVVAIIFAVNISLAEDFGFKKDNLYIGPTVGLNQYFSGGTLGFGARGEYGLMDNVDIGSFKGALGVGADVFYSSFSENYYLNYQWSYTFFSFLVFASYHFSPNATWDPFLRVGLGYNNISVSNNWTGAGNAYTSSYGSGIGTTGDVGINYRLSNNLSIRASLGYPVLLAAGVDFNLGTMGWQVKK